MNLRLCLIFTIFYTTCLCPNISMARRPAAGDDDENHMGHSHQIHHAGQKKDQEERKAEGKESQNRDGGTEEPENGKRTAGKDCSSERHASFIMPSPFEDDEGANEGKNAKSKSQEGNDASKNDKEKVVELRMNKYYAVHRDRFYIRNTGHSLEFRLQLDDSSSDARIRGPDWNDEFVFSKGVFHWQLKNLTVKNPDGTTVFNTNAVDPPLEMELVHYAKEYGSLEKAALKPKGVLVTGHLFELVGRDNPALEPISRSALSTTFPNDNFKQVHGPLDIKSLFPSELSYLEYAGAYPMNPCATDAKYIVFTKPLFVSARQLKRFGGLRTEDGKKISDELATQARKSFEAAADGRRSGRAASANAIYLSLVDSPSLPNTGDSLTNPGISKSVKKFYTAVILIIVALKYVCNFFKSHIFFAI